MWTFLASLSFFYLFSTALLLWLAWAQYRDNRNGLWRPWRFRLVWILVLLASMGFLYVHIHAPQRLRTYSNLDHSFLRQDGFLVKKQLRLGGADTSNFSRAAYNEFILRPGSSGAELSAVYAEEPAYYSIGSNYRLLSPLRPVANSRLELAKGSVKLSIHNPSPHTYVLQVGEQQFERKMEIRKGLQVWHLFRDHADWTSHPMAQDPVIAECLKSIYLVRDSLNRDYYGDLSYFFSQRLWLQVDAIRYNGQPLHARDMQYERHLEPGGVFTWGIAFLDNNRNQFYVRKTALEGLLVSHRYPPSYPLTEEERRADGNYQVSKFLVSSSAQMGQLPPHLREGFLFEAPGADQAAGFPAQVLQYGKAPGNSPLHLSWGTAGKGMLQTATGESSVVIPAINGDFDWLFSIQNSFNWQFASFTLSPFHWQLLIFGALLFYGLIILLAHVMNPHRNLSLVTQVLAIVALVLLTTRYFLYWRYKSFPPFQDMDLPSQQQLLSFGNLLVLLLATLLLGLFFAGGIFAKLHRLRKVVPGQWTIASTMAKVSLVRLMPSWLKGRTLFFAGWFFLLLLFATIASVSGFDTRVCRHLALALLLGYFVFLYISYRHSPLVREQSQAWWKLHTGKQLQVLISNPVKIILSLSLLSLLLLIDIGFAIVFFNFLLFHEAFLCINYGVAGLAAGSHRNAGWMTLVGFLYMALFALNIFFAPYIFGFILELPPLGYLAAYVLMAWLLSYILVRMTFDWPKPRRRWLGIGSFLLLLLILIPFFPREKMLNKAAMTRYRIHVLTEPVAQVISKAYSDGKNHVPVIRAAQNQWFINSFVEQEPEGSGEAGAFRLLPHAPQNKGARYNAQATDLVASRFMLAEHGRGAVWLYVLLLMLPGILLASFYKLYPDFTSRVNPDYPQATLAFSVLNYLLITALMVLLAATGRYIFFGQDLPFASILSKQSVLYPLVLFMLVAIWLRSLRPERFLRFQKSWPALLAFLLLGFMLLAYRPSFNRNKTFNVEGLAQEMDAMVQQHLQPVLDAVYQSAGDSKSKLPVIDRLFCDSLREWVAGPGTALANAFLQKQVRAYLATGFVEHRDQRQLLYLDREAGRPVLQVNYQYFRLEPPPHLQASWKGDVVGDSNVLNIAIADPAGKPVLRDRLMPGTSSAGEWKGDHWKIEWQQRDGGFALALHNLWDKELNWKNRYHSGSLGAGASMPLYIDEAWQLGGGSDNDGYRISLYPDPYMRNYYVNGSRFYYYPMGADFIWARNFAEAVSIDFAKREAYREPAVISLNRDWMDSLQNMIQGMMDSEADYPDGAQYGISIVDGNGRVLAIADHTKGLQKVDPNDKAAFHKLIVDEAAQMSVADWRRQLGNINMLRLNPGPGSTLKPVVFAGIASQMPMDWSAFASQGFSEKQHLFGGMRVPEYDFEVNHGRVGSVAEYIRLSDNYYHANLLLLGSYRKQPLGQLIREKLREQVKTAGLHWPFMQIAGREYFMDGFANWPGYQGGEADFGDEESFISLGLTRNFGISTHPLHPASAWMNAAYDNRLFGGAARQSGFVMPEWSLFDQKGLQIDHRIPYDLFLHCFRGHVKGSSQVMISPLGMAQAFGRLVSQNRNYALSFNPAAQEPDFAAFDVDSSIRYVDYLNLMRLELFKGMKQVVETGTAAALGRMLDKDSPYFYFGKTGTTGDEDRKAKSKLFCLVISQKDLSSPDHVFRDNPFLVIYFTSQSGPPRQNEAFQASVIRFLENSSFFQHYMGEK